MKNKITKIAVAVAILGSFAFITIEKSQREEVKTTTAVVEHVPMSGFAIQETDF